MRSKICTGVLPNVLVHHVAYSKNAPSSALSVRQRIVPPYYRRTMPAPPAMHKLQEEFPNAGDASGAGPRLYDYEQMGDMVRALPTIAEKIDFVNPYERPWTKFERTWHRPWHPDLMSPRKAWNVPSVPRYFDALNFYKYITKTRVVDGLDRWYEGLIPPTATFQAYLVESLIARFESNRTDNESERTEVLLRSVLDAAMITLARNIQRLQDCRISFNSRCESFWIRAGFMQMYEKKELDEDLPKVDHRYDPKFIGDDRRKLGELAFVLRDQLAAHVRCKQPLRPLFPFSDVSELNAAVFDASVNVKEDVIYSPKVFNMWHDEEPLWQCPGFEPDSGDEDKYGLIALKDVSALNDLCVHWEVQGDEEVIVRKELLTATAVASLFSWLNGQAHSLGFTQYNDVEWPLVSQLVLSDGRDFFFAVAQLNTIAINIDVDGFVNDRSNVCYVEGPLRLYDRYDSAKGTYYYVTNDGSEVLGLNPRVMARILQMFIKK
ncbi:28S ribosomal protein S30, mitochondrial [Toxocara canis]|uniref:28S ribosomal protein S30, mitochondrial n=1 Tax=Toxocara canis TaxID=6265 RepID=A0A0B2UUX8_TOXCA|nr:28S ribosomal protein S30, mitochondrial [Toxocara canis]